MIFLEKIIVSLFSALILSLSLAFLQYTPMAEQEAGVGYSSFGGLLFIYLFYSLPVYLIGGGLYSFFVDLSLDRIQFRNKLLKYFTEFVVYAAGGLLIIGILLMITLPRGNNGGLYIDRVFILGAVASLLFFHISLSWRKIMELLAR